MRFIGQWVLSYQKACFVSDHLNEAKRREWHQKAMIRNVTASPAAKGQLQNHLDTSHGLKEFTCTIALACLLVTNWVSSSLLYPNGSLRKSSQ